MGKEILKGPAEVLADFGELFLDVEGKENLRQANEWLKTHSLLLISNHPNTRGTVYGIDLIAGGLKNRKETGILMTSKFAEGRMGWYGQVTLPTLEVLEVEYLKVYQYYDNGVDQLERSRQGTKSVLRAKQILSQPGGLAILYPEGTRTEEDAQIGARGMVEAQPGLGLLAQLADGVLTVVTEYKSKSLRPEVSILPLVDAAVVHKHLRQLYGREEAKRLITWGLMMRMAQAVPEINRGIWRNRLDESGFEGRLRVAREMLELARI